MQRHGRLAGTGPALDDHDTASVVADDEVLLALDRLDDRPHVPRAGRLHRLEQRRLTADALAPLTGTRA